ncbi:MAG: LLM class flavin-dependent oxidoreductase [Rhodospirillales bacterium]
MHIALLISHSPSPHTVGQWRLPGSWRSVSSDPMAFWQHIARTTERGCFDMVFLADAYSLHDAYRSTGEDTIRYAVQYPRLDPLPLVPVMAQATRNLGFAATASTTFLPPYWTARHFATLDHLTEGRIGWNVVTSYARSEAANFGIDDIPDHDARYDRAEEYLELCYRLWDSWEPGAVVADRETGVYADPAKVHRIDFKGKYFRCEGPLHVPRSPQGRPFIIQAGSSPRGLAFAGKHAEAVFAVRHDPAGMKRQREKLEQAAVAAGRAPDAPKILWGILPVVGETRGQALRKQQAIFDNIEIEAGLAMMSGHFNYDLSKFPIDQPLPKIDAAQGIQGQIAMVVEDLSDKMTLGDVAKKFASGIAPHVVGTASEIADQMEALLDQGGGHGFMLVTHALPGSVDDFVDLVVPELQRRGRFRSRYDNRMLRDRFEQG